MPLRYSGRAARSSSCPNRLEGRKEGATGEIHLCSEPSRRPRCSRFPWMHCVVAYSPGLPSCSSKQRQNPSRQLERAREGEGEQEGGPQGHPSPSSTPYPYRHEQQGDGGGTLWSSIFPDPVVLGRCTCILPQESTTCCAHHVLDQMPHQIGKL